MRTLLAIGLALSTCMSLFAQEDERVVMKRVDHSEVPDDVVTAIQEDFPNAVVDEISILTGNHFEQDWVIQQEDMSYNKDMHFYAIRFYGDGIEGKAVYDETGEMIRFKETIEDTALPPAIRTYLGENYGDWVVTRDKEIIKKSPYGDADLYEVTLKKGKEKKTLYFDGEAHTLTN